jgi:glycosyltransferase involved in cell wall biosynthesis
MRRLTINSDCSNIVITTGLHPPWNHGEAVAMRNIVFTIKLVSRSEPIVYSSIDKSRFEGKYTEDVHYIEANSISDYTSLALKSALGKISETQSDTIFLHLNGVKEHIVYSLINKLYSKISFPHKELYLIIYDFGEISARWRAIPRPLHLYFDSAIGKLLTTSISTYKCYGKFIRMNYLPVPYLLPENLNKTKDKECEVCIDRYDITNSIGYIGHLYENRFPYKLVLKAVYKLVNSGFRDLVLVIVAPRTQYNLEMGKLIKSYGRSLNLEKNLLIIIRNIDESCKHKLLKYFKIFLFVPIRQPVSMDPPMSIIEAMASKALVVTTEYLSLKYFIKDGINGVIVEDLNADILYKKIKNILNNNYLREQITQNAREYVLKNHCYRNVAKIFEEILKRVRQ